MEQDTLDVCESIFESLNRLLDEKLVIQNTQELIAWIKGVEGRNVLLGELAILKPNSIKHYDSIIARLEHRFHQQGWGELHKHIKTRVDAIVKETHYQDQQWSQPLIKTS